MGNGEKGNLGRHGAEETQFGGGEVEAHMECNSRGITDSGRGGAATEGRALTREGNTYMERERKRRKKANQN